MKRILFALAMLLSLSSAFSQKQSFTLEVSSDTVLMDNYIIAKFSIINTDGDFEAPEFRDWDIVSGPNTSSMFSMVNGKTTKQSSYTYYLKPKKEGELLIEPAYLLSDTDTLETMPHSILSLPNPDGKIIEPKVQSNNNMFRFSFPNENGDILPDNKIRIKKENKKKLKTRKL